MLDNICPFCKTSTIRQVSSGIDPFSRDVFYIVRCSPCGLAFTRPLLTSDALAGYYHGFQYAVDLNLHFKLKVMHLLDRQHGRLLDIGCGRGDFLAAIQSKGWQIAGVDISDEARVIARNLTHPPIWATVAEVPAEAMFDVITFWHSLEHFANPQGAIEAISKNMRKGANLIIGVPNIDSLQAKIFGRYWYHLDVPRHQVHFSPSSLRLMLEKTGFEVEQNIWDVPINNAWGYKGSVSNLFGWTYRFRELPKHRKLLSPLFWLYKIVQAFGWPLFRCGQLIETWLKIPGTFVTIAKRVG